MDAVVTAGGRISGTFAERTGVTIKALLCLGGRTLVERTVSAVRRSRYVERVCVVGPPEVEAPARSAGADVFVREAGTGIDNLLRGIETLQARGRIFMAASDLPFMRSEDVDLVIERTPSEAEISYVIFTREEWDAAFPGCRALFFRLGDGDFTGASVYVLDTQALKRLEPVLQRAFQVRKSRAGMARLLGLGLTARLVAGHLIHRRLGPTTHDALRRVEELTGCRGAIVRGCSPRVANDIDREDDWAYACRMVADAGEG